MERRKLWLDHFCENKNWWANGTTKRRLEKYREDILNDADIWSDILLRHGGQNFTPSELKESDIHTYNHAMGNLTGMISHIIYNLITGKNIQ